MKKLIVSGTAVLLLVLLLVGYSFSDEQVFEGESDNWEANFTVSKNGSSSTEDFVLTYKGDVEELSDIEELKYSFEYLRGSTKNTLSFDEKGPGVKEFTDSASSVGEEFPGEDEVIEVYVEWGEHEEQMELRSE